MFQANLPLPSLEPTVRVVCLRLSARRGIARRSGCVLLWRLYDAQDDVCSVFDPHWHTFEADNWGKRTSDAACLRCDLGPKAAKLNIDHQVVSPKAHHTGSIFNSWRPNRTNRTTSSFDRCEFGPRLHRHIGKTRYS